MKNICISILLALSLAIPLWAAPEEAADADLCEIIEIPSLGGGDDLKCLAFIPAEIAGAKGAQAAMLVLPDRAGLIEDLADRWGAGDVPDENSMILLLPDISPKLCRDTAFARLSEVMQAVGRHYRLDPERLHICGVGAAAGNAFFAARVLPDKFASLIGLGAEVFENGGFLKFAALTPDAQIEAVKSDPSTYRDNVEQIALDDDSDLPDRIPELDPSAWEELADRARGMSPTPSGKGGENRFVADRLRFSSCGNYQILDFQNYNLPASIRWRVVHLGDDGSALKCASANVATLQVRLFEGVSSLLIDGSRIVAEDGSDMVVQKRGKRWRRIEPPAVVVTRKNPDCGGPLSDALLTPCVFVYGTKSDKSDRLRSWARSSAEEMGRADMRIMSDSDVLADEDIAAEFSLVCFGGSDDNLVVSELPQRKLPGQDYLDDDSVEGPVHTYLQPSPFALDRYVVVNESEESTLPAARLDWASDWAVYQSGDEAPVATGSFDRQWEPEEYPEEPWEDFGEGM